MEALTIRRIVEVVGGRWLPVGEVASDSSVGWRGSLFREAGSDFRDAGSVLRDAGSVSNTPVPAHLVTDSVSTDSRGIAPGELFVPIVGDHFDGHDFVGDVATRAAAAFVAADRLDQVTRQLTKVRSTGDSSIGDSTSGRVGDSFGLVVVDDTLDALERLATWYRRRLSARVIGITGSAGKTTVKEFTGQLLERSFETVRAKKSFNNRLGVALTLLEAKQSTRFLVVEMGTNAPGEIEHLAAVVEPDMAIVTGVGAAHLGGLGSLAGIAREKSAIIGGLSRGGLVFLPSTVHGDRHFVEAAAAAGASVRRFGWYDERPRDAQYSITRCEALALQRRIGHMFEVQHGHSFELPLPGRHNVLNALIAIAVGREIGLDWRTLRESVRGFRLPPLRLSVSEVAGVTVVDDSYNANPSSVRAAFAAVEELKLASGGRWHVVLGDLLELGPESPTIHEQLGEELVGLGCFSTLWTVGSEARRSSMVAETHGLPSVSVTLGQRDAVVAPLVETLRPGDGVLLKGSRGVGLDRTAALLRTALAGRVDAVAAVDAAAMKMEGAKGASARR